ncbi:MAG: hypothetical protein AAB425_04745, partial [Bdellovibrionota bacterium]
MAYSSLKELANGVPSYYEIDLPESSYIEVRARRLAHARIVWVDFEVLREMGIDVPPEGLTEEFEQELLEEFANAVPGPDDPDDAFVGDEETIYYVDRYGGGGLDGNFGSGRAASRGKFQTKGMGPMPVIGDHVDFGHRHGGAAVSEGVSEAEWGQYNHKRLPRGGNRVALLIATGTDTVWEDGRREPRVLIVRQDPHRPAHYTPVQNSKGKLAASDPERTRAAVERFQQAGATKRNAKLIAYVRWIAQQYATAYAMRIYHGATSPSNIEMSGRWIDYGTETTQPGYGFVQTLRDNDPFGMTDEFKSWLIADPMASFRSNTLDPQLRSSLPSDAELFKIFDAEYEQRLRRELVSLLGVPREISERLQDSRNARKFRILFREVAEAGAEIVDIDHHMPETVSLYSMPAILTALAEGRSIEELLPAQDLRSRFLRGYHAVMDQAMQEARSKGIQKSAFRFYVSESGRARNRIESEFFRPSLRWENAQVAERYMETQYRDALWDSIDRMTAAADLHLDDPRPFEWVLGEKLNRITGERYRHVFDAKG